MRETREERKHRKSIKAQRAVNKRWADYHASCACPVYEQHHAYGEYEIIVKSKRSGIEHKFYLHEGSRRDNFHTDMDGKPWKSLSICSMAVILRKSIVKTRSGRII